MRMFTAGFAAGLLKEAVEAKTLARAVIQRMLRKEPGTKLLTGSEVAKLRPLAERQAEMFVGELTRPETRQLVRYYQKAFPKIMPKTGPGYIERLTDPVAAELGLKAVSRMAPAAQKEYELVTGQVGEIMGKGQMRRQLLRMSPKERKEVLKEMPALRKEMQGVRREVAEYLKGQQWKYGPAPKMRRGADPKKYMKEQAEYVSKQLEDLIEGMFG